MSESRLASSGTYADPAVATTAIVSRLVRNGQHQRARRISVDRRRVRRSVGSRPVADVHATARVRSPFRSAPHETYRAMSGNSYFNWAVFMPVLESPHASQVSLAVRRSLGY